MEKEILEKELQHLEQVKQHIGEQLLEETESRDAQQNELVQKRKEMWEECAHGVNDFDDIVSMNAYDETVREKYGHFVRKEEAVRQLSYMKDTPYFGRIDFLELGERIPEEIYIGRYGFRNKKTREYEIYDWRTPIASMFYDNGIGEAAYQCPAGEIHGELTCKRQYKIEDGVLKYCYDTNVAVQDDVLEEVLAGNTDKVLRVIIDTITREQNQAIRQPHGLNMLVTGPAGSGKTSVGMHRLAYLLYHNRAYLSSEKIVVLSRNQIFSSYVSEILPELGEENVNDIMFDSLVNRGISKEYKKRDYYEQVEYLLKHKGGSLRSDAIALKYSPEFIDYLNEQKAEFREKHTDFDTVVEFYLYLLKKYTRDTIPEIAHYTRNQIRRGKIYYEDMLVVSYLRILLGAIKPMEDISHVVVDEAQDYNLLQLQIIRTLYPKAHFTILADANQAIHPLTSTTDMQKMAEIFRTQYGIKEITLSKSYRSTAPINEFAFDIIGIHNPELYVERDGKAPEVRICKNRKQETMQLLREIPEDKSIAIITTDLDSARAVQQKMGTYVSKTERPIQYLLKANQYLEEKIVVMPIMLAKGLEFDVVIVWDDRDEAYWEENKNLKYLMCTRALHELYFISQE
ncbi:MAG: AAA family ATPase [Agathobacter sp.]|nr:AAA family ATPase [Agathobacter sp.]